MRDKVFFSLAALLTVIMVFLAIQPGIGRLPTGAVAGDGLNYSRIVIDGDYLNKIVPGPDSTAELGREKGAYFLTIESAADKVQADPELNPHFRIAADIELQFAGRLIRVTARVRPADTNGASQVEMNYSAGRLGNSGWRTLDLGEGVTEVSFEYSVPPLQGEQGVDYIAIRPAVPEGSKAIILESIVLERLP